MVKKSLIFIFVIVGIFLLPLNLLKAQVIGIQWNTFLGSKSYDTGRDIAVDSSGNIYITGESYASWGSPINPYKGGIDAYVACMDSSGNLLWNTFLGTASVDIGCSIALSSSGNIYVIGTSYATWGSPVNAHSGVRDAFVASMDSSGNLLWNTFLGSTSYDYGRSIALDSSENIYVTGFSFATWGSPVNEEVVWDAFVAGMDSSGNLLWNTFLGSTNDDRGYGIALSSSGNIYVTGQSLGTWGSPVNAYSGAWDAFVAKLSPPPIPDIIANGSDSPISIAKSDTLQVTVALDANCESTKADWWVLANTPFGWYYYNAKTESWEPGLNITHQGLLFDLSTKEVLNTSGLKTGTYTFYFGVDMVMDGNVTHSSLYYDKVKVTVTQ